MLNFGGVFQNASKTAAPNKPTSRNWFANSFNGFVIFSLRKCKCLWMMRMPLCTGYMRLDLGCGLLRACGGSPFLIKFICNLLYEGRGLEHMTYTQDARPPRSYVQRNPWTYFFVVLGRGESQPSMFCFNLFDTHTIDIAVLSPKIPGQTEVNLTSEVSPG